MAKSWFLKLFYVPIIIAVALRVLPPLFYGNTRVYDKPIPYEIIDDFLNEDMIQGKFLQCQQTSLNVLKFDILNIPNVLNLF